MSGCLLIFYNKLTLAIFVPCDWCLWWSQTFICGSIYEIVGDLEGNLLLEPPSRHDNIGIYFGGDLCFVMNSSLAGSLTLFDWASKSQIWIYVKTELCSNIWKMCNGVIYIYIYLCVCVCVCVFVHVFVCCLMNVHRKFTILFIIKLMELSLKIEMSHFRVSDIIATRRVIT